MDPFVGPIRAFNQQPCRVPEGTAQALGGILCHWPDNNVGEQLNIYRQSPVMPALVATAERLWRGARNNREDAWGKLPSADDPAFAEFALFERDMIAQRDLCLRNWPFPYVRQTGIIWKLIGPFDHKGDTSAVFPVENSIGESYTVDGTVYRWRDGEARGGTIYVNHFFGFPGHLPPSRPGTVYALGTIQSAKDQDVDFWIGFNENSRSGGRRAGPNPPQGKWSIADSKVWINNRELSPPVWKQPGLGKRTEEIPFVDELYSCRPPVKVRLHKGINKVLVKAPHGAADWKWGFTCVPVVWDGTHAREAQGVRFLAPMDAMSERAP